MSIHPKKQRAGNVLRSPVFANGLTHREDVFFVEIVSQEKIRDDPKFRNSPAEEDRTDRVYSCNMRPQAAKRLQELTLAQVCLQAHESCFHLIKK